MHYNENLTTKHPWWKAVAVHPCKRRLCNPSAMAHRLDRLRSFCFFTRLCFSDKFWRKIKSLSYFLEWHPGEGVAVAGTSSGPRAIGEVVCILSVPCLVSCHGITAQIVGSIKGLTTNAIALIIIIAPK
ncbi:hypothetical protein IEQ34_002749 [Dendrobium chrysotoxum]|uniref:Uncharacterized protein n=1 Tax=Dendrobium chrysotoxum TaxID=161865 RepID=A0AAV7HFE0_DENCH|nr:hypothetical protein IEQ34_002749 [Dendrobium chrysotoxum]